MNFWFWLRSILSENDAAGHGSASRVGLLLITITIVVILIGHLLYQHRMPSHDELTGIAAILTAAATTYGANKIVTQLTRKDDHDA